MGCKIDQFNQRTQEQIRRQMGSAYVKAFLGQIEAETPRRIRQSQKPLLNATETRYRNVLLSRGVSDIMEQAITLRLDPPFKSYTPDLAYVSPAGLGLVLVEVKGPHRFREKGIAKAALAAKTYPQFIFKLADWTGYEWKESALSP